MKGVKSGKLIKIVLLGQTGVGKTSIIRRFVDNKFEDKISATIAIDYEMKPMEYKKKSYQIQIFDTAGQERFKNIKEAYYRMGNGFFVVFDLTNEDSLNAIKDWIEEIKEKCQDPEPKLIILGNKEDLKKNRIDKDIIEKQLENYKNKIYIKTSAKTNINIKQAFEKMIDLLEIDFNKEIKEEMEEKKELKKNKRITLNKKDYLKADKKTKCGC